MTSYNNLALLLNEAVQLVDLLEILTGSSSYFEAYLLDQQFAHPGYSGMVCRVGHNPQALIEKRSISLESLIFIEWLFSSGCVILPTYID